MKTELFVKIVELNQRQEEIFYSLRLNKEYLSKDTISDLRKLVEKHSQSIYNTTQLQDFFQGYNLKLTHEALGNLLVIHKDLQELEAAILEITKIQKLLDRLSN